MGPEALVDFLQRCLRQLPEQRKLQAFTTSASSTSTSRKR